MMRQVRQTTSGVGVAIVTLIFVLLLAVLVVLSNRILSVGPDGASLGRPLTVVLAVGLPVILLAVILFQVARLWHQRSTGQPGARLKTRLVLFFALVTVLTAIPVSLVSINFINSGVRLWLESDVGDALRVTVAPWPMLKRFLDALDSVLAEGQVPAPEAALAARGRNTG